MAPKSIKNFFIYVLSTDKELVIESTTEYFPWTSVSCFAENCSDTSWRQTTENFIKQAKKRIYSHEINNFTVN